MNTGWSCRRSVWLAVACAALVAGALPAARVWAAVEPTEAEGEAFRAAVAHVAGAVVRIEPLGDVAAAKDAVAMGPSTGLVVDPSGLILATTFAVPETASTVIVVTPAGARTTARPLGRDAARGVVLLATDPLPDVPRLDVASRRNLRPGQWAIAVGRAWKATEPSMAIGVVSAVERAWGLAVQTDASVSPMNYGGPLVDIAGRVIGIVVPLPAETAGLTSGTELYDAGIGFAVPLEDILHELPRLRAGESTLPGLLGISYLSRDRINGAPVIASVRQGSPAARAGLRGGDRIVAVDGRPTRRIADVRHAIVPRHAGDALTIAVERSTAQGDVTMDVTATLAARLPPWRRAILGVVGAESSTEVEWVVPGGPADVAGVVAGDRIVGMAAPSQGVEATQPTSSSLAGTLAGCEPGDDVRLMLGRSGGDVEVEVTLAEMLRQVPDASVPVAAGDPLVGPLDAGRIARLEAAEIADPAVAVIPSGTAPAPLIIACGSPRGRVEEADAIAWKAVAAMSGVAVIVPGSSDPRQWSADDVPGVLRGIQALDAMRPVDPARIAVVGSGAGGGFAWLVAERLGPACRGVAVLDAPIPRQVTITDAEPGDARWILMGGSSAESVSRLAPDRMRLEAAGHAVGSLPMASELPRELLVRWATLLGVW